MPIAETLKSDLESVARSAAGTVEYIPKLIETKIAEAEARIMAAVKSAISDLETRVVGDAKVAPSEAVAGLASTVAALVAAAPAAPVALAASPNAATQEPAP